MGQRTVFIVDDDAAVRDSIAELVESVGLQARCYPSAPAFLEAFEPQRPGCLVLDVRMRGMSGMELQRELKAQGVGLPVIVLTGHADVPMAVEAMKAGAVDFLQKPYRDQALLDSINTALSMTGVVGDSDAAVDTIEQSATTLTEREKEVLELVRVGKTSKEIARALAISPRTAEAHRRNLLRKLDVGSVKELILRLAALGHGNPGSARQ